MTRDPNCIFCKIAAGQIPAAKILDDPHALALLDIGPLAQGHVLLIPKAHFVTLDEMPADLAAEMLRRLPALVRAVKTALGADGVNVLQNNGKAAHQEVQHVHFHIIPRTHGDAFHFNWPAGQYPPGRMQEVAQAITAALT